MYLFIFTTAYEETYRKLIKGNKQREKQTAKALSLLRQDPFYPSLKTHKVATRKHGEKWSSWISGDVRIIWEFSETNEVTIIVITLGTHSGKYKVYH